MNTKKTLRTLLLVATTSFLAVNSSAQEPHKGGFMENFGIGVKIGTYGPGLDLHTSITPNLKARIGINSIAYTYNDEVTQLDGMNNIIYDANKPQNGPSELNGKLYDNKLSFLNGNVLFDFYPSSSGIFCITAGAYLGTNKVSTQGLINDYSAGEFGFQLTDNNDEMIESIVIKPNQDGSFQSDVIVGSSIKPYVGIGLGRTISKSRVSCRFDLGAIYQGGITVESDNEVPSHAVQNSNKVAEFELPFSKNLLNWWPMLSFSVSYRIK